MHVRHSIHAGAGVLLLLALSACGSGAPAAMPDVVGLQLDVAKSDIKGAGFGGDVEIVGGGLFGVVDDSNWVVCDQRPAQGEPVSDPRLVVDRECASGVQPSSEPVKPSPSESATPTGLPDAIETGDVEATTVDELLDRLNSADMGGIQVGDTFRFTGELFHSDLWYAARTGDYSVLFSAHGGADDLMVFVDESKVVGWRDGTQLDVVVENVEINLDGEITDGWLRLISATLAG